jgi:hypothetical protein
VRNWKPGQLEPDSEEFSNIADALLYVENSIASMKVMGGTVEEEAAQELAKQGRSITQVEEARKLAIAECRSGMSLAKRAVTSYMESGWDCMHLSNVPVSLRSVWGGLIFLQLEHAAHILQACEQFIATKLIAEQVKPDQHMMETLADALTSIDYFLESMEDNKPIGASVLEVAEASIAELGFPLAGA